MDKNLRPPEVKKERHIMENLAVTADLLGRVIRGIEWLETSQATRDDMMWRCSRALRQIRQVYAEMSLCELSRLTGSSAETAASDLEGLARREAQG